MGEMGLEWEKISKTIRGNMVVHPFSFRLPPGRVLALAGGNGAGKSTILRMTVGLLRPTSGVIRVNGIETGRRTRAYVEQIGYMPDDFSFSPGLTAWETIAFFAGLKGLDQKRARDVLEIVGLGAERDKRVGHFSKGMQQRLLFAQAILAEPPILVLDEPTNGLDPYWVDTLAELLVGVKKSGRSVVFSTHQLDVAEQVADEVIFLNRGRVISSGAVESFRTRYGAGGLAAAFAELIRKEPGTRVASEGRGQRRDGSG
ncbi:MAG: ABC transporter ATP-binding protein [Kyrpidia sp.]|nr:ABC transporter ATP-binding protein [Kyrpidia sp.]MCL6576089.1 ABC transporter ATP-binding protein [Kyrpidia sp.]